MEAARRRRASGAKAAPGSEKDVLLAGGPSERGGGWDVLDRAIVNMIVFLAVSISRVCVCGSVGGCGCDRDLSGGLLRWKHFVGKVSKYIVVDMRGSGRATKESLRDTDEETGTG